MCANPSNPPVGGGVRRRRECSKCGKRFTTFEKLGNVDLKVVKRNGSSEDFERAKLEKGIVKACWKRPVEEKQIEELVDDVEMKLLNRKSTSIKSKDIGQIVLKRLKKLDEVAYLRFASVYLDINNLNDFKKVIAEFNLPAGRQAIRN